MSDDSYDKERKDWDRTKKLMDGFFQPNKENVSPPPGSNTITNAAAIQPITFTSNFISGIEKSKQNVNAYITSTKKEANDICTIVAAGQGNGGVLIRELESLKYTQLPDPRPNGDTVPVTVELDELSELSNVSGLSLDLMQDAAAGSLVQATTDSSSDEEDASADSAYTLVLDQGTFSQDSTNATYLSGNTFNGLAAVLYGSVHDTVESPSDVDDLSGLSDLSLELLSIRANAGFGEMEAFRIAIRQSLVERAEEDAAARSLVQATTDSSSDDEEDASDSDGSSFVPVRNPIMVSRFRSGNQRCLRILLREFLYCRNMLKFDPYNRFWYDSFLYSAGLRNLIVWGRYSVMEDEEVSDDFDFDEYNSWAAPFGIELIPLRINDRIVTLEATIVTLEATVAEQDTTIQTLTQRHRLANSIAQVRIESLEREAAEQQRAEVDHLTEDAQVKTCCCVIS